MEERGREVKVEEETLMTGGGDQEAHGSGRARRPPTDTLTHGQKGNHGFHLG